MQKPIYKTCISSVKKNVKFNYKCKISQKQKTGFKTQKIRKIREINFNCLHLKYTPSLKIYLRIRYTCNVPLPL